MIITVNASTSYDITVQRGIDPSKIIKNTASRVAVITDSNLAQLHLPTLLRQLDNAGIAHGQFVFPAGESSKNLRTLGDILEFLAANGYTRDCAVVALGGGVTGDISGLAAALFLRGIKYVQIPTTLLACVDSSVGGKCAVDLEGGKNMAGAFYQPSAVIINPDMLSTLPKEEFCCGMAEVIKYGLGFDRGLFDMCADANRNIDEIITRCLTIKRDTVQADEFDTGLRRKLNLGHTVGHAIEKCSGYTVSHGRAVGTGMAVICRALAPELSASLEKMLIENGLPTTVSYSADELFAAASGDKKRTGNTVSLIVPTAIGSCTVVDTPLPSLREIIQKGLKQSQ